MPYTTNYYPAVISFSGIITENDVTGTCMGNQYQDRYEFGGMTVINKSHGLIRSSVPPLSMPGMTEGGVSNKEYAGKWKTWDECASGFVYEKDIYVRAVVGFDGNYGQWGVTMYGTWDSGLGHPFFLTTPEINGSAINNSDSELIITATGGNDHVDDNNFSPKFGFSGSTTIKFIHKSRLHEVGDLSPRRKEKISQLNYKYLTSAAGKIETLPLTNKRLSWMFGVRPGRITPLDMTSRINAYPSTYGVISSLIPFPTITPSVSATINSNGELSTMPITNVGGTMTTPPTPTISPPKRISMATLIVTGGAVTGATITDAGTGYTAAPDITISGGGGSGATATATINSYGRLSLITITNGGTGYTGIPTVTINPPGQLGTATASLSSGGVNLINITNNGEGYTKAPVVTISGGGGSGATATATINSYGRLSLITVTNGGTGYTSSPTVTVGSPDEIPTSWTTFTGGTFTNAGPEDGGAGYTEPPEIIFPEPPNENLPPLYPGYRGNNGELERDFPTEFYPIPWTPLPFPEPWRPPDPGTRTIVEICNFPFYGTEAGKQYFCSSYGLIGSPQIGSGVNIQEIPPDGVVYAKAPPSYCGIITGFTSSNATHKMGRIWENCIECVQKVHGGSIGGPPPLPGGGGGQGEEPPAVIKSYTTNFHGRWPTRQYLYQPIGVAPHGDKNRKYELRGIGDGGTNEVYGASKVGRGLSFPFTRSDLFMTSFKYRSLHSSNFDAHKESQERIGKDLGFANSDQGTYASFKVAPPGGDGNKWMIADYENFATATEAELKGFLQRFNVIGEDIPTTDYSFIRLIGMVTYRADGVNRSPLDSNDKQYCLVYCNKSVPASVNVIKSLHGGYVVLTSANKIECRYITEMSRNLY